MNINVILKDEELKILFYAAGGKELLCFIDDKRWKQANIPYLVHEMARRGVLTYVSGKLVVNEPYTTLLDAMVESKYILTLHCKESEATKEILYCGDKICSLTNSEKDEGSVILGERSENEIADCIDELFSPFRTNDCPEELFDVEMRNEKGELKASIELHIPEKEKQSGLEKKWSFYCGRYRNYITEQSKSGERIIEYENWNSRIVLREVKSLLL